MPPHFVRATFSWLGGLALFLCLLPFACSGVYVNDEFDCLAIATRLLAGEVPHRDYFSMLPPITEWLSAGAFALFGPHLLVAHALAAGLVGCAAWQLRGLAMKLGVGPGWAWLPGFALVLGLFRQWSVFSHHWVVLPFELAALAAAFGAMGTARSRPWFLAGLATGLAGMTLQSDGAALALALGLGLALDSWHGDIPASARIRQVLALGLGMLLPVGLIVGVLALQGGLVAAVYDLVLWPLQQYRQAGGINDVPYATDLPQALLPVTALPGWYGRAYHVVFLTLLLPGAAIGALAWLWGATRKPGWRAEDGRVGLLAFWVVLALAIATRGRSDLVHAAQYGVPALLLACVAAYHARHTPVVRGQGVVQGLPLLFLSAFVATGLLMQLKGMATDPRRWNNPLQPDAYLLRSPAIQYLRGHARPEDRLVAAPNGGFWYFYTLPPASRYTLMLPPEAGYGSPGEFEAFWAEVARKRPRFILLQPAPWIDDRIWQARYVRSLPPRYHLVDHFSTPQYNFGWPASLYEADEAR